MYGGISVSLWFIIPLWLYSLWAFIYTQSKSVICSLPSPSLKPDCSGVELPAHSFCHAHCWNLRSHTRAPFYWTRDYSVGIGSPPPSFITSVPTIKFELWSEWICLSSVSFFAPSRFLSYSSSGLLSRTVHVASCWRPQHISVSTKARHWSKLKWNDFLFVCLRTYT
jgi:hypothetical protein